MVVPGLGDRSVPVRFRLLLALAISFTAGVTIFPSVPALPNQPFELLHIVGGEAIIGLCIGLLVRLAFSGLHLAGTVISFQTSLAYARSFDPTQGSQGSVIGSLLAMLGITLVFVTNMHHMMIMAAINSYTLFPIGMSIPMEDFAEQAVSTVSGAFLLGIQMSAPFIVYGLTFYLAIGVLSKLIPQVQIFFVAMPANIIAGFILLMLLLSTLMMWFVQYYEAFLMQFVG
jgi:flagellar biosynthetic protein FliR